MDLVRACPHCGLELAGMCYHEGEDIAAVPMDARKAAELRAEMRDELLQKLELYPDVTDA